MKAKRIFNKEWLSLHPYTNADSVDLYYVNLANRIKKTILGGIKFYWCPVKKENIFILIFMLRLEHSLLRKQNGITSQIVYYHFEDRVLHFKGGSLVAARALPTYRCSLP